MVSTHEDILTETNSSLSDKDQCKIPAADVTVDCYTSVRAIRNKHTYVVRIAESEVFKAFDVEGQCARENKVQLHNIDLILVPCTLATFHWSLLSLRRGDRSFILTDPLKRPTTAMLKKAVKLVSALSVVYELPGSIIPTKVQRFKGASFFQGDNNMNCGPWVCSFADNMMEDTKLDPKVNILKFRKQMLVQEVFLC